MPITISPATSTRFASMTVTDPYTFEEWTAAAATVFASREYRQTAALLIDRRQSTPPSADLVDRMTRYLAEHEADLRTACVAIVATDDVGFGMARMTQLKIEFANPHTRVQTFRDADEAIAWLVAESGKRQSALFR